MYEAILNERQPRFDWLLLLALMGLMAIGASFIYGVTSVQEAISHLPWYRQFYVQQIAWYIIGLGVMSGICMIDYRVWARWSMVFYWVMILLLVAVLFIGPVRYGARRWIDFGVFQFQPSEFSKVAFLVAQANFLSRPVEDLRRPSFFWKGIGLTVLPFVLILKEPDLGSALVLLPVGLVMMYVAGVPVKYLRRLVGGAGILVLLLVADILFAPPAWQLKVEDYQRRRLLVYFGIDYAPADASDAARQRARIQQFNDSYNVRQALIAVGSGGLTGKGWRQGIQNVLGFLPRGVAHNDFIFSVIAEEKGFLGSVAVLMLYTLVLFAGLRIASQSRDRLGKLLAVGVVILLFTHVFINIGMNIRILPVTGIPLPLLSYGGSSVTCSLVAAGILQNVYRHRNSY